VIYIKIGWFRGHQTPWNRGAIGLRKEDEMVNEVSYLVIEKLRELGHEVIDCTPSRNDFKNIHSTTDSLRLRCERANEANVDIVASMHFNYYNGKSHGCEVFYVSNNGKKIAKPIQDELHKLGFYNRGVKLHKKLYVLNHTNEPAILIEGCFCDSEKDMAIFDAEKMSNAIVKGLTGKEVIQEENKMDIEALKRFADSIGYKLVKKIE